MCEKNNVPYELELRNGFFIHPLYKSIFQEVTPVPLFLENEGGH